MHKYICEQGKEKYIHFFLVVISLIVAYYVVKLPLNYPYNWIISLPSGLSCYSILFIFHDRYLWKIKSKRISKVPNLNGNWEGVARSDYDGNEYEFKLIILQTWTKIKIEMMLESSSSNSISAFFYDNSSRLIYNYVNEPNNDTNETMGMHRGTCDIRITNKGELTGNYYTDRNRRTTGRIMIAKKYNKRLQ